MMAAESLFQWPPFLHRPPLVFFSIYFLSYFEGRMEQFYKMVAAKTIFFAPPPPFNTNHFSRYRVLFTYFSVRFFLFLFLFLFEIVHTKPINIS